MSSPRNLYPDTTLFVTVQCVHNSFRLVPTRIVNKAVRYAYAVVSSKYREKWGMEFYEYEFLSTHYHMVLYDPFGRVSDFLQELNSTIARTLNAERGQSGAFFNREPGIQTVVGDEKVIKHCIYTLANAVKAGLVHKTRHWKGLNSYRMDYGVPKLVDKPRLGIWRNKTSLRRRKRAVRSGRAAYAGRSKLPAKAVLMLDRPRCSPELSDKELRDKVRQDLRAEEAKIAEERKGKPVLGMSAVRKIHWSRVPLKGQELFGRQPTFSTQTAAQRTKMKRLRRQFLREYRAALDAFNAGDYGVVFPSGTVRMRLRHKVRTESIPLDLLLAA